MRTKGDSMQSAETALVIMVPEAEELVKPYRDLYDPAAANGIPAHITLVSPFLPIHEISAIKLTSLTRIFKEQDPFEFSLVATARFPGVLYLEPEPSRALKAMILAVCKYAPHALPYGGQHADLVPHLTVACLNDEAELDQVAGDFAKQADHQLPILSKASEAILLENGTGHWKKHATFLIGDEPEEEA